MKTPALKTPALCQATSTRRWVHGLLIVLFLSSASAAYADFLRSYKNGRKAIRQGQWQTAEQNMQAAIAERPVERARVPSRAYLKPYMPHYYLGLARFHQGNCRGALAAWQESQRQGFIRRRKEHEDLLAKQRQCQSQLEEASEPAEASSPDPSEAQPAPPTTSSPPPSRPESPPPITSDEADETVLPPALAAAADAYFEGAYPEVIRQLEDVELTGAKSQAHAALLLAAAHFALHRIDDEDGSHRAAARQKVLECRQADPPLQPMERFFSPSFLSFFASVADP